MSEVKKFIPLPDFVEKEEAEMIEQSKAFYQKIRKRRTIRDFSDRKVSKKIIENCILSAGSAPSGANLQPWHFVVVSDPKQKEIIQSEAEKEEFEFYNNKAPKEWLDALEPLGTDANKGFLTKAPFLIIVFAKSYDLSRVGEKIKNYYVKESVGIACGLLLTALHISGLVTLTHTPSPMAFLNKICKRPKNEKPYMIIVTGYPEEGAEVPIHGLAKKKLEEISSFI